MCNMKYKLAHIIIKEAWAFKKQKHCLQNFLRVTNHIEKSTMSRISKAITISRTRELKITQTLV